MREEGIHKIEVHAAALCIVKNSKPVKFLALHRTKNREFFPNYWEAIGGQVKSGESLEEAVLNHLKEEAGINGDIVQPFATYVIDDMEKIPGVRFLVEIKGNCRVKIDPKQHDSWKWVDENEVSKVKWIPGLAEQIKTGIKLYNEMSKTDSKKH